MGLPLRLTTEITVFLASERYDHTIKVILNFESIKGIVRVKFCYVETEFCPSARQLTAVSSSVGRALGSITVIMGRNTTQS